MQHETFCPIYPQDPHYNGGRPIEHDCQGNEMLKQQDRDYLAQLARIFVYLDNRVVDSDVNKG